MEYLFSPSLRRNLQSVLVLKSFILVSFLGFLYLVSCHLFLNDGAKVIHFFDICKFFANFFLLFLHFFLICTFYSVKYIIFRAFSVVSASNSAGVRARIKFAFQTMADPQQTAHARQFTAYIMRGKFAAACFALPLKSGERGFVLGYLAPVYV